MSQRLARPQLQHLHSPFTNPVPAQAKMRQRLAPSQHPRQPCSSRITNAVAAKVKMSQPLALPQHPRQPRSSLFPSMTAA
eukprot:396792-Rhodomonas_salina.1